MLGQEDVTKQPDGASDSPEMMPEAGRLPKHQQVTYEQMTEQMVNRLQLDEKQQKKIAKLNKKYKTLIEGDQQGEFFGGQRPPGARPSGGRNGAPSGNMGMGGPGGGGFGGMSGSGPRGGMGGPGGGMGGRPGGAPGMGAAGSQNTSYDYDKKQEKYDKAIRKILSESQYDGYLELRPQFASQRRIQDFLMGGQQLLPPKEIEE